MIRKKIAPFKPSVDKRALILLSALVWIVVGTLFLMASFSWLSDPPATGWALFAGMGAAAALVIHHFGFLKVVDKNLGRILPMEGKRCLFSFMTWKSYIMVALMASMGAFLRSSPMPKPFLSAIYIGIGLSLILSSVRYVRVFLSQSGKMK